MNKEKDLYFDIASDEWAGGLYILKNETGNTSFFYHRTSTDLEYDKTTVTQSHYAAFAEFWKEFTKYSQWFTLHPLYIHPEQRPFIQEQLRKVNWNIVEDERWREMYRRQWNKALNNPAEYYKPK